MRWQSMDSGHLMKSIRSCVGLFTPYNPLLKTDVDSSQRKDLLGMTQLTGYPKISIKALRCGTSTYPNFLKHDEGYFVRYNGQLQKFLTVLPQQLVL